MRDGHRFTCTGRHACIIQLGDDSIRLPACSEMIDTFFLERRGFVAAERGGVTAARRERASDDRVRKRRYGAGDLGQPGAFAWSPITIAPAELRDRMQQAARVRMLGA